MRLTSTRLNLLLDMFFIVQAVSFVFFVRSGSESVFTVKVFWFFTSMTLLLSSEVGKNKWTEEVRMRVNSVGRLAFYTTGMTCIAVTMFIDADTLVSALVFLYGTGLVILVIYNFMRVMRKING